MLKREENIGNRAKTENQNIFANILMDDDWDLHAVVRGCAAAETTTTVSTTTTTPTNPFPSFPSNLPFHEDQNSSFDFPGLIDDSNNNDPFQGLQEIYQEFCLDDPPPATTAATDISATGIMPIPAAHVFHPHQETVQIKPPLQMNMQIQENVQFNNPRLGSSPQNFPAAAIPQPIRPRRRKNQQMKMVRQMTQEELSADSWAWRKYGQKPIKGSPYPRNYYRCSTSKGCAARKQVERSPNDPGIFVVSYTGEHTHPRPTHRSSLAGSSRSKFSSSSSSTAVAVKNNYNNNALLFRKGSASSSSPASGSSFSPTTPSMEGEAAAQNDDVEMAEEDDDDGNMIAIPNDLMNDDDDMFRGFQDSDHSSGGGGDLFSSGLLSSPPWSPTISAGNAATFSGGGGG